MRLTLCLGLLAWGTVCFALEDTLPKGAIQFRMEYYAADASEYFDRDQVALQLAGAEAFPFGEYEESMIHLELEYGVAHDLTFVMETDYSSREVPVVDQLFENDGIHGLYVAARQRLSPMGAGYRLMAETGVYVPTGVDNDEDLPVRSHGVDWVTVASYNQDFFPTRGGMEMDFGYRFRNESPENEVFFDTKFWIGLAKVGRLSFIYNVVESTSDDGVDFSPLEYPDSRGFQRAGVELSRSLGQSWRAGFAVYEVIEGRNQFKTGGWRLGFTWRLR